MVEAAGAKSRCGTSPWEAVVERTRAEHRCERDRIHPYCTALEVSVGQRYQHDAGDDRREERVDVENAAQPWNEHLLHRATLPLRLRNPRFERRREGVAYGLELDTIENVLEEPTHDEALRLGAGQPAGHQVEKLLAIDLSERCPMGAANVVGHDLEPGIESA